MIATHLHSIVSRWPVNQSENLLLFEGDCEEIFIVLCMKQQVSSPRRKIVNQTIKNRFKIKLFYYVLVLHRHHYTLSFVEQS